MASPLTVTFTNNSSTNAQTYTWQFGDTGTSALEDPVHTYTLAGTFTVVLTASNPASSAAATTTITVTDSGVPATVTKYYYFGSQRVAMSKRGVLYYLHGDHLGSTSLTTDKDGGIVAQARYLPYGQERWTDGPAQTDFTFTGQRAEHSFGLIDYNARYYDPYLNRFISPDSIVPQPADPQALNRYSYANANPVKYRDPSGHDVNCPGKDLSACTPKPEEVSPPEPPRPPEQSLPGQALTPAPTPEFDPWDPWVGGSPDVIQRIDPNADEEFKKMMQVERELLYDSRKIDLDDVARQGINNPLGQLPEYEAVQNLTGEVIQDGEVIQIETPIPALLFRARHKEYVRFLEEMGLSTGVEGGQIWNYEPNYLEAMMKGNPLVLKAAKERDLADPNRKLREYQEQKIPGGAN